MSGICDRRIPCTRGVEPELRRRRLLAARKFVAWSIPRLAILLGHWDGGSIVASAGADLKKEKIDAARKSPRSDRRNRKPRGKDIGSPLD